MNTYGVTTLPDSWTPLMRSVAKLSYLWPHLEPCDIDAWHSFMQFLQANVEWGIGFLAWAVLAYHCKWPMAVQALRDFMASHQAQRQQQMLSAPTPEVLVEAFTAVISALDDQTLDVMHGNISKVGRMHTSTGPVLFATSIGLIARPNADLGLSPRQVLTLGKGGMEFVLVVSDTARRSFEALLAIDIGGVQLPQNPLAVKKFLPCLDMVAAKLFQTLPRRRRCKGKICDESAAADGSTGGLPYCTKGFTRKILLWLETRLGPTCVDDCTWDAVYGLLPDQAADFHEQIRGETCCRDVRKMFGISPLMVTWWAGLMHGLSPSDLARVQGLSPLTVMRAVDKLRANEQMSPSLARLFGYLSSDSVKRKRAS